MIPGLLSNLGELVKNKVEIRDREPRVIAQPK